MNTLNSIDLLSAIKKIIPDAKVETKLLNCDKVGYYVEVESAIFKNKNLVEQHRIVKEALADFLNNGALHAVTIKTKCL